MLLDPRPVIARPISFRSPFALACPAAVAALALFAAAPAQAQTAAPVSDMSAPALPQAQPTAQPADDAHAPISFEADKVDYDADRDTVTAHGNVFLRQNDQTVRADRVIWNHKTGHIEASGAIRVVDANGNELLTDKLDLTDRLETGDTDNLLLLLREGGRLAAAHGQREANGVLLMSHASYTACEVVDAKGCPKKPSWRVTAHQVTFNPNTHTVHLKGARLAAFGVVVIPLPNISIATDGRPVPGLMIPDFKTSSSNGLEYKQTYYQHFGPNRDVAVTAEVFTKVAPMLSVKYRELTNLGAWQLGGYVTRSPALSGASSGTGQNALRGYVESNGKFQFSPEWSLTYSGRFASDRTFLRRYYINSDDVLRSSVDVERVTRDSYLSIAGWAFQTLRTNESQGLVPIALPEIDYRRRIGATPFGGTLDLQANSLAISRTSGQDTQRAFASAQWNLRKLTPWGQQVTFTALARGDIYHSAGNALTSTTIYQGLPGWQTRGVALGAVDVTWPLVGNAFGGAQVLTPHFQIVGAPNTANLSVPNEDARALELEDGNLFALNRFAGYDRIEDGTRFTYGVDWQLERPKWRVNTTIGQSYRLTSKPTLLPTGTGLTDRLSDIVGRTEVRYRDFFKITHRYRLDKDSFAFRRNEIDATIGTDRDYVQVGYSRINRQITATSLEDLSNSNELRAAARVAFARYWSVFGSGLFDLSRTPFTSGTTTITPSSFQPLRTRVGVAFQSDCFEADLTWRRDYVTIGDAAKGSSFEVHFALKNLGFK